MYIFTLYFEKIDVYIEYVTQKILYMWVLEGTHFESIIIALKWKKNHKCFEVAAIQTTEYINHFFH